MNKELKTFLEALSISTSIALQIAFLIILIMSYQDKQILITFNEHKEYFIELILILFTLPTTISLFKYVH